jgi:hypothetical protein
MYALLGALVGSRAARREGSLMSAPLPSNRAEYHTWLLAERIQAWTPPARPHCANCLHAKVFGAPEAPEVRCAQGHGRVVELVNLIRAQRPVGPAAASSCADYSSMGDD